MRIHWSDKLERTREDRPTNFVGPNTFYQRKLIYIYHDSAAFSLKLKANLHRLKMLAYC